MNAQKTIEKLTTDAQAHTADLRMVRTIAVDQWVRQGDICVQRISAHTKAKPTDDRQLAPGTTKGSRHIVVGDVTIYPPIGNDPLTGPTIHAPERFTVTHPEHADVSLPSGDYAVTYQRDYAQEERARVAD